MQVAQCEVCGKPTPHEHLHDTAHGIPETHMAGSERFICTECGNIVRLPDNRGRFRFILDEEKPEDDGPGTEPQEAALEKRTAGGR